MKKFVIIRTYSAGVHFGTLESKEYTPAGIIVVLSNTQRVYSWRGAASLSQMANEGVKYPNDCKFSQGVSRNELIAIEILDVTETAMSNLLNVPIWKI